MFRHDSDNAKWPGALRPVDVQFDKCGRLYVTEDGMGSVIERLHIQVELQMKL